MVFVKDTGSVFPVPLPEVWEFLGSGTDHPKAHGHRNVSRSRPNELEGTYAWEQDLEGLPVRFVMHWRSYHPVGLAYDVPEGPFQGSKFFLIYTPRGEETEVSIIGDFVSPTIPEERLPAAVLRFFEVEFEQDLAAMVARRGATRV